VSARYAIALALLTGSAAVVAQAKQPSAKHVAWCQAAVASLPRFREDADTDEKRAELDRIARAVATQSIGAPMPPRRWAALILTVWKHESGLSSRIIAGDCRKRECDGGRARGGGQVHRNTLNAVDWDAALGNVDVQVKMTGDALKRAYWTCSHSGEAWDMATLAAYAGKRCGSVWPGMLPRLQTLDRLEAVQVKP
jgi:hypothetical protein